MPKNRVPYAPDWEAKRLICAGISAGKFLMTAQEASAGWHRWEYDHQRFTAFVQLAYSMILLRRYL